MLDDPGRRKQHKPGSRVLGFSLRVSALSMKIVVGGRVIMTDVVAESIAIPRAFILRHVAVLITMLSAVRVLHLSEVATLRG